MTEAPKKITSSVKLFNRTIDEVNAEKDRRIERLVASGISKREAEKRASSYAEIIEEAWRIARAAGYFQAEPSNQQDSNDSSKKLQCDKNSIASGKPLGYSTNASLQAIGEHGEFGPMVDDFNCILRGKQDRAIHPLKENLKGFRLLTDLLIERGGTAGVAKTREPEPEQPGNSIPAQERDDFEATLEKTRVAETAFREQLSRAGDSTAETLRMGEELKQPSKRVAKGKRGNRRRASGRGGN